MGLLDRKVLDGVRSSQWGWLSRRQFDLTSFFTHKAAARARSTRGATRGAQRSLSILGPLPLRDAGMTRWAGLIPSIGERGLQCRCPGSRSERRCPPHPSAKLLGQDPGSRLQLLLDLTGEKVVRRQLCMPPPAARASVAGVTLTPT